MQRLESNYTENIYINEYIDMKGRWETNNLMRSVDSSLNLMIEHPSALSV